MSLEQVKKELASGEALLVDVREQDEWDECHVEGAVHLPMSQLAEQGVPDNLPKDKHLYIHCARGGRAKRAAKTFRNLYKEVTAVKWGPEALAENEPG